MELDCYKVCSIETPFEYLREWLVTTVSCGIAFISKATIGNKCLGICIILTVSFVVMSCQNFAKPHSSKQSDSSRSEVSEQEQQSYDFPFQ